MAPRYINVAQGSEDWQKVRLGIPTASEAHKIITPTGKPSKQAGTYMLRLIAEQLMERPIAGPSTEWMERGRSLEEEAARQYEWEFNAELLPVGFFTTEDGRFGASPDRLIKGVHAGCELKAPAPHTHLDYRLFGFGDDYRVQVAWQAWVCEFEYVDLYSFCPEFPRLKPVRERHYRDEEFIAKLADAAQRFADEKDTLLERVRREGLWTNAPVSVDSAEWTDAFGEPVAA